MRAGRQSCEHQGGKERRGRGAFGEEPTATENRISETRRRLWSWLRGGLKGKRPLGAMSMKKENVLAEGHKNRGDD